MKLTIKYFCLLLSVLLFQKSDIKAQHVLNGSFEDNTLPWTGISKLFLFCNSFTHDVFYHTNDSLNPEPLGWSMVMNSLNLDLPTWNVINAPHGKTFVSFPARDSYLDPYLKQLVMTFSEPLIVGETYTVRYASAAHFNNSPLTDVPLTLALGKNRFNASREVDSLQVLDIKGYREYAITFIADDAYTYLFFYFKRPVLNVPPPFHVSGEIMIDNIRLDTCITTLPKRVISCVSFPLTVNAATAGKQILWNTGDTTQSITVNHDGVFIAHIYDSSGCMLLDSIEVISSPFDKNPTSGTVKTLCVGDSIVFKSPYNGSYLWNTGATTQTITVTDSTQYWVNTTTPGGCHATDSFKITLQSPPVIPLVADTPFCNGESIVLNAYNPLFTSYLWNTASVDSAIVVQQSGTYSVIASNGICIVRDSVLATQVNIPVTKIDTSFCEYSIVTLKAANASSYLWSTGETTGSIDIKQPGLYWVQKMAEHCIGSDSFMVTQEAAPVITSLHDTTVCFDEVAQILLDAGQFKSYLWKPTGETTRTIHSTSAQVYLLSVTNNSNCITTQRVAVMETCPEFVFVPNAFTPNGDGLNDVFLPHTHNLVSYQMSIVNRWGEIIFTTQNPQQGWDGKEAPADVYTILINYKVDGKEPQTLNQNVSLLR